MQKKLLYLFLYVFAFISPALAYEKETHEIEIKDHKFYPNVIETTKDKVIKLRIFNKDKTIEEFESFDLKREKIVAGNRKIVITVGPLKPGEYIFFGELHPETAQGKLIIK
jgi:hypothetical protein